jgi:hypothetical protein
MSKVFLSDCGELKIELPDGSCLGGSLKLAGVGAGTYCGNLVVNTNGKVYTFSKAEQAQKEDLQERFFLDFVRRSYTSCLMRAERKKSLRRRRKRRGW